jgi:hypothetical protein
LGGWVDISDFSNKNRNDTEIEAIFSKCALMDVYKNIFVLTDGMANMCYVNKKLLPFVNEKPDECVDLLDDTLTNQEIKNQLLNLRNRKRLLACENCNGFLLDGGDRKIPAQQEGTKPGLRTTANNEL